MKHLQLQNRSSVVFMTWMTEDLNQDLLFKFYKGSVKSTLGGVCSDVVNSGTISRQITKRNRVHGPETLKQNYR